MTLPHAASLPDHGLSHGLPNAHYTNADVISRENAAVLAGGWASIGFAKDVANKGDVAPVTFLEQPLMLVRGSDGNVRVFENVCRHRGMILVDQPTNFKGTIRYPYHSWCYAFDGKLRTTPHVGGPGIHTHADVDPAKLGLYEVRSAVWMDVVFVNLDRQAPAFEDFIRPVAERWHDFAERPLYHGGEESTFELEVNCNWKLAVENYCESYHLPWVHPALNEYSKLEDHYEIIDPDGNFSGQGTRVYSPNLGEPGRQFATFNDLPAAWDTAAEYISLFPNTLLGVHKDHTFAIRLEPLGPSKTREHVSIYYASEAMCDGEWGRMRQANAQMWRTVFNEDVFAVEGMQRGRNAGSFDGGALSPVMDMPTRVFHEWVAKKFADDRR